MNGFSAADMSTAAANGFRDGLASQLGAAQEAVAYNSGGIELTACQLHEALLMAGSPELDVEFDDRSRVRIFHADNGHSGPGFYCECVDVEEEGCILLDGTSPAIAAPVTEAPEWQPIETAPEGRLVVVGWLDTEDSHFPENYEFDYLEDGLWAKHADCVEHAHAVAPPGSKMPKEQPPYQWWMDLPAFPAARPQGVKE